MTVHRFGRATATNPGKHGDLDWRVEFNGTPPTLAEVVFMFGFHLLAEDRYNRPQDQGRHKLWPYLEKLADPETWHNPEKVIWFAETCQAEVDCSPARNGR